MPTRNPAEHKKSIAVAYQIFADLLLGPFDDALIEKIALIPELKSAFDTCYGDLRSLKDPASELAADHFRVFGMQVFPFEGCFLSKKATSDSELTEEVSQIYGQCGFNSPRLTSERPDHLGLELQFLAFLISIELRFSPNLSNSPEDAPKSINSRKAQQKFLQDHLLQWLFPLKLAVTKHHSSFFSMILEMVSATVLENWSAVDPLNLSIPPDSTVSSNSNIGSASNSRLNETFDIDTFLSDPKTGLGSISRHLLNPAKSGFFLSRDVISELGSNSNVPSTFGSRESSLKALLENAIDYGKLSEVFLQLGEVSAEAARCFRSAPRSERLFLSPWITRALSTEVMVKKIRLNLQES